MIGPEFDIIIVGSGPAGVSAAFPLLSAGLRVLMVDGGHRPSVAPPARSFLSMRSDDPAQWEWMLGREFHAIKFREAASPKLRAPTHDYVFKDFIARNRIAAEHFIAVGSLAQGGLSNAWGCGVARFSDADLAAFPCPTHEWDISYRAVAMRMGISGSRDDDLREYFGLDEWAQPPVELDVAHAFLEARYHKQRSKLINAGFRMGRSRVAALTEPLDERLPCNLSGNCLWGCSRRALYSAADDLIRLRRDFPNFRYEAGFVVEGVSRAGSGWKILSNQPGASGCSEFGGTKIMLAAGTLATTRLVLDALQINTPVRVLSSPTAAFLLWLPTLLGIKRQDGFGLGQLSFALRLNGGDTGFGSTFATTGIPVTEFARHLPFGRRHSVDILRNLLSSCLAGNMFLPGHLSEATARLDANGSLLIKGGHSESVPDLMAEAARKLRQAFWHLGGIVLPMSFTMGKSGGDIHYAGTLPMRQSPRQGETDGLGTVQGLENIHAVDGACLPLLPEKSHTLTIMANADRIARAVAKQWRAHVRVGNEFSLNKSEG
ncbi:Choline dehydrogenase [Noviherbaspirillum humi]|uniref:Choline dehydrogenase n=1 Tax=Noviherbaspirillum humi TaxID=1688639 RepID=A0A239CUD3_9BURK|nr:FAD-dependent oxidoreductase [Noviherbaspirillum humi]SNS23720.1 Choline dehydrogenase [Noviherbaspirillum humi]